MYICASIPPSSAERFCSRNFADMAEPWMHSMPAATCAPHDDGNPKHVLYQSLDNQILVRFSPYMHTYIHACMHMMMATPRSTCVPVARQPDFGALFTIHAYMCMYMCTFARSSYIHTQCIYLCTYARSCCTMLLHGLKLLQYVRLDDCKVCCTVWHPRVCVCVCVCVCVSVCVCVCACV